MNCTKGQNDVENAPSPFKNKTLPGSGVNNG